MLKLILRNINTFANRHKRGEIRTEKFAVGLRSAFLCFALFAGAITFLILLAPNKGSGERDATVPAPPADAAAEDAIAVGGGSRDAMTGGTGSHNPNSLFAPTAGQPDEPFDLSKPTIIGDQGSDNPTVTELRLEPVDPNRLAVNIDPQFEASWLDFRRRHPGIDPTDEDQFHLALIAERERLPDAMSSEQREIYGIWLADTEGMRDAMIRERARLAGLQTEGIAVDGRDFTLTGFDGLKPVYTYSENHDAAISTAASFVRRNTTFDSVFGADIDGSGFWANINDTGIIADHTEFRDDEDGAWRRIIVRGTQTGSGHGTRVAGTFGARGVDPQAMGMVPAAHLYSFTQQQNSDVVSYGMDWPGRPERSIIGNTSLGTDLGDLNGLYTATSASFDSALYDTPYYLHFYSVGNSGPGFFTLTTTRKDAKNLFAVASVSDVTRDSEGVRTGGGVLASSSSWGPTRDGRIKPDIAANGVSLYGPTITSDGVLGYSRTSGTSRSAPNASGSALLLQDYFSKRFRANLMRASTLMALIIHTAEDLGNPGPDYKFGWGLMNTLEAARVIQRHADTPTSRLIREERLLDGDTHAFNYQRTGDEPLRVTLVWTDPPGPARSDSSETAPVLVNDLNVVAISPSGTTNHVFVMPYVIGDGALPPLHPDLFDEPATTGMNYTDNKIQLLVNDPEPGIWNIEIFHTGDLHGGMQMYSLVLGGLEYFSPAEPPTITSHTDGGDSVQDFSLVEVQGSGFILGAELWFYRGGYDPVSAYAVEVNSTSLRARLDHSVMADGSWLLAVRNPDGMETFSTQPYVVGEPSEMDPPYIAGITVTGSAHIALQIEGFGICSVQASPTLLDPNSWITLETNITPFLFTETNAVILHPIRFYRLKSPQNE